MGHTTGFFCAHCVLTPSSLLSQAGRGKSGKHGGKPDEDYPIPRSDEEERRRAAKAAQEREAQQRANDMALQLMLEEETPSKGKGRGGGGLDDGTTKKRGKAKMKGKKGGSGAASAAVKAGGGGGEAAGDDVPAAPPLRPPSACDSEHSCSCSSRRSSNEDGAGASGACTSSSCTTRSDGTVALHLAVFTPAPSLAQPSQRIGTNSMDAADSGGGSGSSGSVRRAATAAPVILNNLVDVNFSRGASSEPSRSTAGAPSAPATAPDAEAHLAFASSATGAESGYSGDAVSDAWMVVSKRSKSKRGGAQNLGGALGVPLRVEAPPTTSAQQVSGLSAVAPSATPASAMTAAAVPDSCGPTHCSAFAPEAEAPPAAASAAALSRASGVAPPRRAWGCPAKSDFSNGADLWWHHGGSKGSRGGGSGSGPSQASVLTRTPIKDESLGERNSNSTIAASAKPYGSGGSIGEFAELHSSHCSRPAKSADATKPQGARDLPSVRTQPSAAGRAVNAWAGSTSPSSGPAPAPSNLSEFPTLNGGWGGAANPEDITAAEVKLTAAGATKSAAAIVAAAAAIGDEGSATGGVRKAAVAGTAGSVRAASPVRTNAVVCPSASAALRSHAQQPSSEPIPISWAERMKKSVGDKACARPSDKAVLMTSKGYTLLTGNGAVTSVSRVEGSISGASSAASNTVSSSGGSGSGGCGGSCPTHIGAATEPAAGSGSHIGCAYLRRDTYSASTLGAAELRAVGIGVGGSGDSPLASRTHMVTSATSLALDSAIVQAASNDAANLSTWTRPIECQPRDVTTSVTNTSAPLESTETDTAKQLGERGSQTEPIEEELGSPSVDGSTQTTPPASPRLKEQPIPSEAHLSRARLDDGLEQAPPPQEPATGYNHCSNTQKQPSDAGSGIGVAASSAFSSAKAVPSVGAASLGKAPPSKPRPVAWTAGAPRPASLQPSVSLLSPCSDAVTRTFAASASDGDDSGAQPACSYAAAAGGSIGHGAVSVQLFSPASQHGGGSDSTTQTAAIGQHGSAEGGTGASSGHGVQRHREQQHPQPGGPPASAAQWQQQQLQSIAMHHGYVQTLLQPGADRGGLSTQHGNVPSMPGLSTTLLGRRPLSQQQYLALLKQSNGNHEELGDGGEEQQQPPRHHHHQQQQRRDVYSGGHRHATAAGMTESCAQADSASSLHHTTDEDGRVHAFQMEGLFNTWAANTNKSTTNRDGRRSSSKKLQLREAAVAAAAAGQQRAVAAGQFERMSAGLRGLHLEKQKGQLGGRRVSHGEPLHSCVLQCMGNGIRHGHGGSQQPTGGGGIGGSNACQYMQFTTQMSVAPMSAATLRDGWVALQPVVASSGSLSVMDSTQQLGRGGHGGRTRQMNVGFDPSSTTAGNAAHQTAQSTQIHYAEHTRLHHEVIAFASSIYAELEPIERDVHAILKSLREIVASRWVGAKAELYGSRSTGLALSTSDMDVVLLDIAVPASGVASALRLLSEDLEKAPWVRKQQLVQSARIPVLKLQTSNTGVPVDVTIASTQQHTGLAARDLVQAYTMQAPQIIPLVLVLKTFLRSLGLNDPYTGGISSYCIVVLLHKFWYESERTQWFSTQDCGALLFNFLQAFVHRFEKSLTHVDDPLAPPVLAEDGTLLTPSENIMQSCYQITRLCQMFRRAVQVWAPSPFRSLSSPSTDAPSPARLPAPSATGNPLRQRGGRTMERLRRLPS